jgi:hypothetical protein
MPGSLANATASLNQRALAVSVPRGFDFVRAHTAETTMGRPAAWASLSPWVAISRNRPEPTVPNPATPSLRGSCME